MSVCQQRDISALCLPCPDDHRCGRDRTIGKGVLLCSQWHHRKSAATPPFPNVGSRLNAIYFESSRKVCTASFMLCCGPNRGLRRQSPSVAGLGNIQVVTDTVTIKDRNRLTEVEASNTRSGSKVGLSNYHRRLTLER
ncbi:hypothetical protein CHARACLAT_001786 [Characodon lateralis]|uniref:Uncharacterized protein n=1 Tax=Characodon lateralis TaxID=208331 RepID=A0ABU7E694_9TELE|nr:hypothetical protein [Characodon lateralis]